MSDPLGVLAPHLATAITALEQHTNVAAVTRKARLSGLFEVRQDTDSSAGYGPRTDPSCGGIVKPGVAGRTDQTLICGQHGTTHSAST